MGSKFPKKYKNDQKSIKKTGQKMTKKHQFLMAKLKNHSKSSKTSEKRVKIRKSGQKTVIKFHIKK